MVILASAPDYGGAKFSQRVKRRRCYAATAVYTLSYFRLLLITRLPRRSARSQHRTTFGILPSILQCIIRITDSIFVRYSLYHPPLPGIGAQLSSVNNHVGAISAKGIL